MIANNLIAPKTCQHRERKFYHRHQTVIQTYFMRRVIFAFFALQMVLTIHGQNTYSLGNSGSQSTWFKLGTLSLDQQGRDAIIRISGGHGYNATIDQNAESVIHFRTSNGSSVDNEFYGTGSFYNTGRSVLVSKIRIVQINFTTWDFYAYLSTYSGESANLVVESAQGSWSKDFQAVNTPPTTGVYSDLKEELVFQSPISFSQNIGIGTTSPQHKLDINGNTQFNGMFGYELSDIFTYKNTTVPHYGFRWNQDDWYSGGRTMLLSSYGGFKLFTSGAPHFFITANGNVGIKTENPRYELDVLGTIRAKEVLVNLDGGADFVFEKDYKLPALDHVATYVQENKHLPDIPSANEMTKNGVSMGDMQVKLLQKVEELTLYVIELNKKNIELERELNYLKKH
jgi:hypothetical protein